MANEVTWPLIVDTHLLMVVHWGMLPDQYDQGISRVSFVKVLIMYF